MTRIEAKKIRDRNQMCNEFPLIEQRLMQLGLFKTARKMNEIVSCIGWECAEMLEKSSASSATGENRC